MERRHVSLESFWGDASSVGGAEPIGSLRGVFQPPVAERPEAQYETDLSPDVVAAIQFYFSVTSPELAEASFEWERLALICLASALVLATSGNVVEVDVYVRRSIS